MLKKYSKVIILLLIIEFTFVFLSIKSFSNNDIDKVKEISKVDKEKFAMYKENSSGGYDEITDGVFPSGYSLNMDKSSCVDSKGNTISNILSWNNNKLTITSNKTAYCYLYFDKINGDVYVSVSTDGEAGVVPNTSNYTKSISCPNGTSEWNNKYNRLEISSLNGNQVVCNLAYTKDTSTYTTLKSEVESKATSISLTNNAGTTETSNRYTGKQPDNWVWFNEEKWRIIGSIPVTLSDGTTSNLVKIIRPESIGGLAFHSDSSNSVWGTNTLYDLLNNYYYGKKDATGVSPCYGYSTTEYVLCNYEESGIESNGYYGRMIKEVYWNVGTVSSTSTIISTAYTTEVGTKSTVTGKIGLMNASDYGYATSGITYSSVGLSSLSSYTQSNWLYYGDEWTLTPNSTKVVLYIFYRGNIGSHSAHYGHIVRPVIYLDSSVYVVSGEGTIDSPYIIGMN